MLSRRSVFSKKAWPDIPDQVAPHSSLVRTNFVVLTFVGLLLSKVAAFGDVISVLMLHSDEKTRKCLVFGILVSVLRLFKAVQVEETEHHLCFFAFLGNLTTVNYLLVLKMSCWFLKKRFFHCGLKLMSRFLISTRNQEYNSWQGWHKHTI